MDPVAVNFDLSLVKDDDQHMTESDNEDYSTYGISVKEQEKHMCQLCEKYFSSARALQIHTRIHTGEKPYACTVCKESFAQYGSLKLHMAKHGTKYPYECSVCSMSFAFQSRLNNHLKTHDPNRSLISVKKKYECNICGKMVTDLMKHQVVHTGVKQYQCKICQKSFTQASYVNVHIRTHTGKPFICGVCDRRFLTEYRLKQHLKKHHGKGNSGTQEEVDDELSMHIIVDHTQGPSDDETSNSAHLSSNDLEEPAEKFDTSQMSLDKMLMEPEKDPHISMEAQIKNECDSRADNHNDECVSKVDNFSDERFSKENNKAENETLQGNISSQPLDLMSQNETHGNTSTGYSRTPRPKRQCKICGKFVTDMPKHKLQHASHKPYSCSICHKSFYQAGNLNIHMRQHTGDRPYKCGECDKKFTTSSQLKVHLTTHGITEIPPKKRFCNICEQWFTDLSKHKRQHTGVKQFKCSVCGKAFNQKGNFNVHMRTHTGIKPFECDLCGQSFAGSANYKAHKASHTQEFSLFCPICNKGFIAQGHLNSHIKIHSNARPFNCNVCGQSFKRRSSLNAHTKEQHTSGKPFNCSDCGKKFTRERLLRSHMTNNNGDEPIACDICGKHFKTSSCLNYHMIGHKGHNSFPCTECEKQFSTNILLQNHLKSHVIVSCDNSSQSNARSESLDESLQNKVNGSQSFALGNTQEEMEVETNQLSNVDSKYLNYQVTSIKTETIENDFYDIKSAANVNISQLDSSNCMKDTFSGSLAHGPEFIHGDAEIKSTVKSEHEEAMLVLGLSAERINCPTNSPPSQSKSTFAGIVKNQSGNSSNAATLDGNFGSTQELPCVKFGRCCLHGTIFQQNIMNFGMTNASRSPYIASDVQNQRISDLEADDNAQMDIDEVTKNALAMLQQSLEAQKELQKSVRSNDREVNHEIQAETGSLRNFADIGYSGTSYMEENLNATADRDHHTSDPKILPKQSGKAETDSKQTHRRISDDSKIETVTAAKNTKSFEGLDKKILEAMNSTPVTSDSLQLTPSTRYECEFCKRLFVNNCELKKHRRTHTGDKPYRCDVCDKGFAQKGNLNIHKRIHTKEKPFECSVCGEKFNHKSNLKYHVNKRHPDMEKMTIITS